ncbi:MAG: serine/threonine-protein kinase, partial [bacterium]
MQELPAQIGKYQILGLAGEGAMGAVYIAHDPVVDRKVAIKVATISEHEFGGNLRTVQRVVFNEAQVAGGLDHPQILRIYDAGEADGQFFIAMEYVEGAKTLRDYTRPDRLAPVESVLKLVGQCADALDYAHRRGVTHRDIKPANIMLTTAGDVKICDFGIAQRTQTDATEVMGLLGSPLYTSPEQARDATITPQSDLFSLGVVLYELLTGTRPFAASDIAGVLYNILHKDPEAVTALRPELPKRLDAIVKRALAKETGARYGSGAEMAADLAHVLVDQGRSE